MQVLIDGKQYVNLEEYTDDLIRLLDQDIEDADSVDEKSGLEMAQKRISNTYRFWKVENEIPEMED